MAMTGRVTCCASTAMPRLGALTSCGTTSASMTVKRTISPGFTYGTGAQGACAPVPYVNPGEIVLLTVIDAEVVPQDVRAPRRGIAVLAQQVTRPVIAMRKVVLHDRVRDAYVQA